MSGGYTHITLTQFAIEDAIHHRADLLHEDAKLALGYFKKFCIVGALAPDYPYLDITDSASAAWADDVHKGYSMDFLRSAVPLVRNIADDNTRRKCIAWLFGFASHMATDGTIHPVVNLKVGPYEQNKTAHRRCEMSQDVHSHKRLNIGAIDFNQQISTNVNGTSDKADSDRFDPDVAKLWRDCLMRAYPNHSEPDVHSWHRAMRRMMKIAEGGNYLFPFVRHVAANQGLVYPKIPEDEYIKNLKVPNGTMDFDQLFDKAKDNVLELWAYLALSLQNKKSPLDTRKSWCLDTGIDENKNMIYWS